MKLSRIFKDFFASERAGGLVLAICTVLSLLIANSNWGEAYSHFWHHKLDLSFAFIDLNLSVEQWINDGLMTIFFLMVGLEIERELYAGELKEPRNALLPIVAALGGMAVPAAIHYFFNQGTSFERGFGIPMATDIAFAIGMLSLAGNRVPPAVKIFLTALAIIDDLGAILVIAIFYSAGIQLLYLGIALFIGVFLFILNKKRVTPLYFYLIPGIVMWYCMLRSGIHPTIAGVVLAFLIPFSSEDESTPSYKLQHFLHNPVAFLILPIFALANTGIKLNANWFTQLQTSNSIGIISGLVVGKTIGILLFSWIVVKAGWSRLPESTGWRHMTGVAMLGGIGFTMSIFISNLAFDEFRIIEESKLAVLTGSFIACLFGLFVFKTSKKQDFLIEE